MGGRIYLIVARILERFAVSVWTNFDLARHVLGLITDPNHNTTTGSRITKHLVTVRLAMDDVLSYKDLALLVRDMNECEIVTLLRQVYPQLQDIVDNKVSSMWGGGAWEREERERECTAAHPWPRSKTWQSWFLVSPPTSDTCSNYHYRLQMWGTHIYCQVGVAQCIHIASISWKQ